MDFIKMPTEATLNTVSFPGLGLEFDLNRVAINLFGHNIYWYGIIIGIGFLLAVLWCCRRAHSFGVKPDDIYDLLIAEVPLCLVGCRAYYVIFNLDQYRRTDGSLDWGAMVRIGDGGIAIYGGVITAALVLWVFCRWRKWNFFKFADLGVQGLLIGQLIGRWGNFMNVEAYGGLTDLPWRMYSKTIENALLHEAAQTSVEAHQSVYQVFDGGGAGVHPTFLYESLWNLVGLILIYVLSKKLYKFDGQLFFTYLTWYGLGRFWIEGLRTDSLYFFGTGIRVSQAVALLSVVIGGGILIWKFWSVRKNARAADVSEEAVVEAVAVEETAEETTEATTKEEN